MKKIIFAYILSGIFILCPFAFGAELTYHFIQGAESKYRTVANVSQTIVREDAIEPLVTVTESITFDYTEKVTDIINPTRAKLSNTFDAITATAQVGSDAYSYDSASGTEPAPYFSSLSGLIGKTVGTVITDKGQIIQMDGTQEMQESMISAATTGSTFKDTNDINQTIANVLPAINWHFPDGNLSVGNTWTRNMTLPFPQTGNLIMEMAFTLASFENVNGYDCAKITFSTTMKSQTMEPVKIVSIDESGVDSQTEIYGSGNGSIYFAYQEGFMVKAEISLSLKMNAAMAMIIKGRPFFSTYNTDSTVTQTITLIQHTLP